MKRDEILVGYSGFVGSNLNKSYEFSSVFNSSNVKEAYGSNPDLCVYAGVRAEKFLANKNREADLQHIHESINNIININPKKLILISTIDVYPDPVEVDEFSKIDPGRLLTYGRNRYFLEVEARKKFPNSLIIRLPGLYGINLKKNFIYDLLHPVPKKLSQERYEQLSEQSALVRESYSLDISNFYVLSKTSGVILRDLESEMEALGFTSLSFTDSRSSFQFYNLSRLWSDILTVLNTNLATINLMVEPLQVSSIYEAYTGKAFCNQLSNPVPRYDVRTIYANLFSRNENSYISLKEEVLIDVLSFLKDSQCC